MPSQTANITRRRLSEDRCRKISGDLFPRLPKVSDINLELEESHTKAESVG